MELFDRREPERIEKRFRDLKCGDMYEDGDGNICICTEVVNMCDNGKCISYDDDGEWGDYTVDGGDIVYPLVASITIHKYSNK